MKSNMVVVESATQFLKFEDGQQSKHDISYNGCAEICPGISTHSFVRLTGRESRHVKYNSVNEEARNPETRSVLRTAVGHQVTRNKNMRKNKH